MDMTRPKPTRPKRVTPSETWYKPRKSRLVSSSAQVQGKTGWSRTGPAVRAVSRSVLQGVGRCSASEAPSHPETPQGKDQLRAALCGPRFRPLLVGGVRFIVHRSRRASPASSRKSGENRLLDDFGHPIAPAAPKPLAAKLVAVAKLHHGGNFAAL